MMCMLRLVRFFVSRTNDDIPNLDTSTPHRAEISPTATPFDSLLIPSSAPLEAKRESSRIISGTLASIITRREAETVLCPRAETEKKMRQ
jgi:hypothetical protein